MVYYESNYLEHYCLKGMKWGQRRWQNPDGTFNEAGKARYFGKSAGGKARRALAKVYGLNERVYGKLGNKTLASMNKAAKEEQLRKASAADQARAARKEASVNQKNAKRQAKEASIDNQLKNAKSASEAERALRAKVRNDLAKSQGPMTRAISTITGRNASVAEHLVRNLANQTMMDVNKNARSKMTLGQKAVDVMVAGNTARYTGGGYKNLGKAYDTFKSEKGLKSAEKAYRKDLASARKTRQLAEHRQETNRRSEEASRRDIEKRRELGLPVY